VHHAVLSGATWLIDTVGDSIGAGESLAIDRAGNLHIAYCGFGPQEGINYVIWTTSGWIRESVDGVGCGAYAPSLVLDSSDQPNIAYYDATNDDLKYAHTQTRVYLALALRG
jgi:hypothetical protein